MSRTDWFRVVVKVLFALVIVAAVAGWWADKDPSKLSPVIAWCTGALAIGEGANLGKRMTYNKDHHEVPSA
jgi:hypothetical protein